MEIRVAKDVKYQTFEGFGASGAWWAQCVGKWTRQDPGSGLQVRERIAQLLFASDEGIGLRTYRYNLGAGSADSGKGDIDNPLRRTESFFSPGGGRDFSRDSAAVDMMRLAVRYGAEEVIFFVNSPPEFLTKNGLSHCDGNKKFRDNLPKENYAEFARCCLDAVEHFLAEGIPVRYLSPINEPLWVWTGGQEGCHYGPRSAGRVMRVFAEEADRRPALADLKLSGLENGDIRWLNKTYTRSLMKYPRVRARVDGVDLHSYFLNPFRHFSPKFLTDRPAFLRRFRGWMERRYPDMNIKMSEWCHMRGGRDSGMDSALVTALVIYEDLTMLNAVSWQHWIAVSEVDYCDGLIYINLEDESFEITKRYYVTGNFSKYIPFGAVRVAVDCPDAELKALAFVKDGKTTLIVINPADAEKSVTLPAERGEMIITDASRNLGRSVFASGEAVLPARSVNTFLF